jgi:hypothetical protein
VIELFLSHYKEDDMKLVAVILAFVSTAAFAQNRNVTEETRTSMIPAGWTGYFGATTGAMDNYNKTIATEGMPNSIKILGSHAFGDTAWVGDAGLGWQFHTVDDNANRDVDVINTGLAELAGRYQFANHWEVGLMYNGLFTPGARDSYGSTDDLVSFMGPEVLKDFTVGGVDMRFGLSAMTDLNIPDEDANTVMAHLHIRFGGAPNPIAGSPSVEKVANR